MHHLDDRDLLALLQIVLKNGNLMSLVDVYSNFKSYEEVEMGINWLQQTGKIIRNEYSFEITPLGVEWRTYLWKKLGLKGLYRYFFQSQQAYGSQQSFTDPFIPKKIDPKKKG